MNIVLYPDPILRQVCEPCEPGHKELRKLGKQMAKAMYKNNGVGLAAPQIGLNKRFIVIDCGESDVQEPIFLTNPEIIALEGDPVTEGEGCLSCPGISVPVKRQPFARVKYYDLDGEECFIEGEGLLGRCLQHEINHLEGKTLFELCEPSDRFTALRDYQEACEVGAKPGETRVEPRVR